MEDVLPNPCKRIANRLRQLRVLLCHLARRLCVRKQRFHRVVGNKFVCCLLFGKVTILHISRDFRVKIFVRAAQEKLNILTRKYKQFSDAAGLDVHKERMSVSGFHRVKSTSEVARAMRAPLKDTRTVGKPVDEKALQAFADKAKKCGVGFAPQYGSFGGFENYCGEPRVLDEALEHLQNGKNLLTQRGKDDTILLQYHDILDQSGRIDPDTFAMVNGRTITLNRFMYDDTEHLKREYAELVRLGHFTRGTDYRNVIDHEMGHVLAKRDKSLLANLRAAISAMAEDHSMSETDFVRAYVSKYANYENELLAELYAKYRGNDPGIAAELFREVLHYAN